MKPRCQQGCFLLRPLTLACRRPTSPRPHIFPLCVPVSYLKGHESCWGRAHPHFYLHHLLKTPSPGAVTVEGSEGQGSNIAICGATQFCSCQWPSAVPGGHEFAEAGGGMLLNPPQRGGLNAVLSKRPQKGMQEGRGGVILEGHCLCKPRASHLAEMSSLTFRKVTVL